MSQFLSRLVVSLEANSSKFYNDMGKAAHEADKSMRRISNSVKTMQRTVQGFLGLAVVQQGFDIFKDIVKETADAERTMNALHATLRATGNAAGLTAGQIGNMAEELKKTTVFDDDEITKAATALLRFRTIQKDTFTEGLKLAPDLATALGTQLPDAATTLGKALTDPANGLKGLKAAGVYLSEQQIDLAAHLVETGKKAEAQKIILDSLAKSVGGAAAGEKAGLYGSAKSLENAWKDLEKAVGKKLFEQHDGPVQFITKLLDDLAKKTKEVELSWPSMVKAIAGAGINPAALAKRSLFGDLRTPEDRGSQTAVGQIKGASGKTVAEEIAEQGAAETARQEAEDAAYKKRKDQLMRSVEATDIASSQILAIKQNEIDKSKLLNDEAYRLGDASITDYYAKQKRAVEEGLDAQLNALGKKGAAIQNLMGQMWRTGPEKVGDYLKLQQVANESDSKRIAAAKELLQLDIQQRAALVGLGDTYGELAAKVLQGQGKIIEAEGKRFAIQNRLLAKQAASDPEAAANFAAYEEMAKREAALQTLTRDRSILQDQLSNKEAEYAALAANGSMTTLEAEKAKHDARQAAIADLAKIADKELELSRLSGDPARIQNALNQAAAIKTMGMELDPVIAKWRSFGESLAADWLVDAMEGNWKDIGAGFTRMLNRMVAEAIAADLMKRIMGSGGGKGNIGGLIGMGLSWLGGGKAGSGGGPNMAQGLRAGGGTVVPGMGYLVGENEPEIFQPSVAGNIVPVPLGGREQTIINNFNLAQPASRETQQQVAAAAQQGLMRAARRNN